MTSHLDWIATQHARMVNLVTTWSGINTGSHHLQGLERFATALAAEFGPLGGTMEMIDLPEHEIVDGNGRIAYKKLGRAIRITKRPSAPRQVLLAIHYDTVFAADHPFQNPTRLDSNTLRGPGVADAKGGLAVLLTALEAFERSDLASKLGWEILLTPDEELGSPGSSELFTQAAMRNDIGLVFEPALPDGSLVSSRKGSGNFTAIVTGRAAHAGRNPELGRNAILALADFIVGVHAIPALFPGVTVNVGHIEGGGPVNIVPDLAIARFNIRVDSLDQQHLAETRLQHIITEINSQEGITLKRHGCFTAPPKLLDLATLQLFEQFRQCGRELNLALDWRPAGGVCDGNRLAAAGLPTIDTLGPRGGNLHSDTEYLLLDSLTERAKLTALFLFTYAAGEMTTATPRHLRKGPS